MDHTSGDGDYDSGVVGCRWCVVCGIGVVVDQTSSSVWVSMRVSVM